jgi:hypothetical protein
MVDATNPVALVGWVLLMAAAAASCVSQARKTRNATWRVGWLGLLAASVVWLAGGVWGFASPDAFRLLSDVGVLLAVLSAVVLIWVLLGPRRA